MRADLISRVRGVKGLSPVDQANLTAAIQKGGRGALRDMVSGQPYAQDVLQAINGNIGAGQNAPGQRPAVRGGAPGGGLPGAEMAGKAAMAPVSPAPLPQAGLTYEVPSAVGDSGVSADAPPMAAPVTPLPTGAPAQPGADTSLPVGGTAGGGGGVPAITPQPGQGVPMGGITNVWNPQAREKLAAERGWGFVQQVQDAMKAATGNLPQGTGARRDAIYAVLQQFGLAGGGAPSNPPLPAGSEPTRVPPTNQAPPIYQPPAPTPLPTDRPPVGAPPIYIPPQLPQTEQQSPPQPQQFPDIFNPVFF
jgi:hypothetical protein